MDSSVIFNEARSVGGGEPAPFTPQINKWLVMVKKRAAVVPRKWKCRLDKRGDESLTPTNGGDMISFGKRGNAFIVTVAAKSESLATRDAMGIRRRGEDEICQCTYD